MKAPSTNPSSPLRSALLAVFFAAPFTAGHAAEGGSELKNLMKLDLGDLLNLQVSTASRYPESYARTPGTLLVVNRQQIRERGYRTLAELLADMPSVDVQNLSDGTTGNRVAVRGVVGNNKLMILQDGVRISSPTGDPVALMDNFPLYHVRQVEVVYGPASALYGADAFTGVVNLITGMDTASGSEITLEGGSFGHRYSHFNLVKAVGESARLQFGGHWREDDNADLSKYYPEQFATLRSGDRYNQPTASRSLNARLDWSDAASLGWNHSRYTAPTSIGAQPASVLYSANAEYITQLDTLWGEWRWRLNDALSGRVTLDWSRHETDPNSEFVNAWTNFGHSGYKYSLNQRWHLEPQITWERGGQRLIAGLNLEWFDALPKTANLPRPYDQGGPFYYPNSDGKLEIEIFRQRYQNRGAYVQYSGEIDERTLLHLGVRYDDNSVYGSSLTPRAGINRTLGSGMVLKYLYGESFLAPSPFFAYENWGGFNAGSPAPLTSYYFHVPNPGLQPERLRSHELRLIYTPSPDMELNAGLYRLHAQDIIYRANTPAVASGFVPGGTIFWTAHNDNVGVLEAGGIDMGFDYTRHGSGWKTRYFGNASYTDGELSSLARTVPLPFVSRVKVNLGLTWTLHNTWQITPKLRWVGDAQGPIDNGRVSVPGYATVDLYARWLGIGDKTDLFLRIDNLLDRRYVSVGDGGSGGFAGSPQEPRRVMVGVTLGF